MRSGSPCDPAPPGLAQPGWAPRRVHRSARPSSAGGSGPRPGAPRPPAAGPSPAPAYPRTAATRSRRNRAAGQARGRQNRGRRAGAGPEPVAAAAPATDPGQAQHRSGQARIQTRQSGPSRDTRGSAQHEALPGHHPAPQVGQRVRLYRQAGRAADRQLLERAGHDLVDPGERLLSGYLAGRAALGDRAPHRAAQEHDHAIAYRGHDPERGSAPRHVADNPGGQAAGDRVGRRLPVGADLGGQPSSSWTAPPGRGRTPPRRGIRMTVSPNRPTRPGPGSMPMRVVGCPIALPLRRGDVSILSRRAEQAE